MFRFSIRELFLLTLIAGLALGWWLRERAWDEKHAAQILEVERWHARTEILADELERKGHEVSWSDQEINVLTRYRDGTTRMTKQVSTPTP